jgi:serine protease
MFYRSEMKSIWFGLLMVPLVSCNLFAPKEISGTISIAGVGTVAVGSQVLAAQASSVGSANNAASPADFVPGEVLVTFKTGLSAQSFSSLSVGGIAMQAVRASGLERTSLYRSAGRSKAQTLAMIEQLKSRPDVAYAEPNRILHAMAVPNDTEYSRQWHYGAINLPLAWDIETGTTNPVTVAVVDTGLLIGHPDIQGKFLPGYDFISSSQQSNDGNGRDNNPDDPGRDETDGSSSYHGSHVAGTIAALSNNNSGVAGVSWGAKILPVRVLGVGGGSTSDIIDGILWSAGVAVAGVPANPNPAQIINLSLGGGGRCDAGSALQRMVDQVNAKGAIVVVAAGNENVQAADTIPASCSGVITVGGTNRAGSRAALYSNFGPRVDVMAPGGQSNGTSASDEVLSLSKNDTSGAFNYDYKQGTSMATPHVAGVLALMKSRDPNLSFSRALSILKRTARPLTVAQCTSTGTAKTSEDCGAGLIDANAAVAAVNNTPDYSLTLSSSSVIATRGQSLQIQVVQTNANGFAGTASLQLISPNANLGSISGTTLTVNVPSTQPFGAYVVKVQGNAGGNTRQVSLSLNVIDTAAPTSPQADLLDTSVLFCYYVNNTCDLNKSQVSTISKAVPSSAYVSPRLEDGSYAVLAWKDVDNNSKVSKGDLLGGYYVGAGFGFVRPPAQKIDLSVDVVQSVNPIAFLDSAKAQVFLDSLSRIK